MMDGTHFTIIDRLDSIRDRASHFRTNRRKDIELYELLADCLRICEQCSEADLVKMIDHVTESSDRRRYFEKGADAPLVIGRYVFEGEKGRAASYRYTGVLREAIKRDLRSDTFSDWLKANGGINELWLTRPVKARTSKTKTLYLSEQIEVPKGEQFSVTLRRGSNGKFDVVDHPFGYGQ